MARTWVLLIGLTLLGASVCAGMEEYAEPVTEDVGVGEVTSGVADPGTTGGYEATEPKPEGDYYVADSGVSGDGEVIGSEPQGDPEVIEVRPDDGYEVVDPGTSNDYKGTDPGLDRDYRILTMLGGGDGGTDSMPEGSDQIRTMVPDISNELGLTQFAEGVLASVGLPEQINEWAGLSINAHPDLGSMPELTQVWSSLGLDMAAQMNACADAMRNVPQLTGQLDNVVSQISGDVMEAFGAIPISGIVDLLANQ